MALFLFWRNGESDRRPSGQHSALVSAADESAARTLGGIPSSWSAHQLATGETMPNMTRGDGEASPLQVVVFEGDAISLRQVNRGGDPVTRDKQIV